MTSRNTTTTRLDRGVGWFYLATPGFWLVDAALDWSFRIAGLETFADRSIYYALLTAVGVLVFIKPAFSLLVAALEPALNFALLIIDTYRGFIGAGEAVMMGQNPQILDVQGIANLLLNLSMMWFGFQLGLRKLRPG